MILKTMPFAAWALSFACRAAALAPPVEDRAASTRVLPVALLPFQEKGEVEKGSAAKVDQLLFASLAADSSLYLVDRADLAKTLDEHQLNLSGIVSPETSVQVGQLTGARILVTGSVFDVSGTIYVVAKIIGTETSVVLGESVKGKKDESLATLTDSLAGKIAKKIESEGDKLVAKERKPADRIADLRSALGDSARPSVRIQVRERHVGQLQLDPAAQTELARLCKETGFVVLESGATDLPDVTLEGEGVSELLTRRGELASVKGRVEVRAVERKTGRVIAVDRQTAVIVGLGEQLAGKAALERAAAEIADRLLPKLVQKKV
ncbi:MAG: hypothetical protein HYR85_22470 [Planctomycetes bacterium]|nr:hypothetical protein [Planctomycetota bacterium]